MLIVFASITFYSSKTTYLAAATATAHDKKQFRDSLPPNPPPKGKRWQKTNTCIKQIYFFKHSANHNRWDLTRDVTKF